MEKKKIGMTTLVLLVLLAIVAGCVAGYYVSQRAALQRALVSKNNEVVKGQNITEQDNIISDDTTPEENKDDLDVNNVTTINGKTFNVSFKKEKLDNNEVKATMFLNNKRITSFYYNEITEGLNVKNSIIKGDEEYLLTEVDVNEIYLVIMNQDEELVDIIQVRDESITLILDDMQDYTVNEDSILYLRPCGFAKTKNGEEYNVAEYKVTIENGRTKIEMIRLCKQDEVSAAGKS